MTLSALIQRHRASGTKITSIVLAAALVAQFALSTIAQAGPPPSADLDQCGNGPVSGPVTCTGANWQNGNLNATNSHYAEGQSAPYRVVMENLPTTGTLTLVIEYDIKHSDRHALDYLTSFDRTETTADPCSGVTGCSLSGTAPFPAPSSSGSPVSGMPTTSFNALPSSERQLSLYNATIAGTGITYVTEGDLNASQDASQVQIQFTASSSTVVLAWGGHVGSANDWGASNSAGGISGSPYHMRLVSLTDANLGNQDRSMSADAVEAATPTTGTLIVIKDVINDDGGTAVASDFTMNVTGTNVSASGFPGSDTGTSVTLDAGSYSVTEDAASGYTASYSADCSGTIAANETKTCTVTNDDDEAAPTTGTLTIEKIVVNDNGGTATVENFQFFIYEAPGQVVDVQSGVEVNEGEANVLEAGTYWVSEQGNAGGYYQATFSGACDGTPYVTLAAGEDLTCTITNDDTQGGVTVIKEVEGGQLGPDDFELFVGSEPVVNGVQEFFDNGAYTVSETPVENYVASYSGDCDAGGELTVVGGFNVTCTITNTYVEPDPTTGTLVVIKHVDDTDGGSLAASDFDMTVDGPDEYSSTFPGEESPGTTITELAEGSYTVSESTEANYVADFSECGDGGIVAVSAGEVTICTITNTYVPPAPTTATLTVIKTVVDSQADPSSFTINVSGGNASPSSFPGSDTGTEVTVDIDAEYTVSEEAVANYVTTYSEGCSGTMTSEGATCTVTNTYDAPEEEPETGTLTVVKVVINDNGGSAVVASFPLFVNETSVTSGTPNSLPAGTYYVTETGSPDYTATFSGDCDANGVVSLEVDDQKTCTITNDDKSGGGGGSPQAGTLIVVTKVVNDDGGSAVPSSFLMTVGDGTIVTSTFGGFDAPGFSMAYGPIAYVVNGSDNAAYDRTIGPNCSGVMSYGATITCVVTYDDRPTGGSPNPPEEPPTAPPQPEPEPEPAPTPIPQVLGATDSDLPVTGIPAWMFASVLLAAAPFLRRKQA